MLVHPETMLVVLSEDYQTVTYIFTHYIEKGILEGSAQHGMVKKFIRLLYNG